MDESASIMSQVKNDIANRISDAIYKAKEKGDLPGYVETEIKIETPARPEQGDFATGVAMSLAREVQSDGRSVAGIIVRYLSLDDSWIPVSYTHLDVYKRQALPVPGEEFSTSGAWNGKSSCLLYTSRCV